MLRFPPPPPLPPLPATMRPEAPKYFLECNNPGKLFVLTPKTLLKYPNSHLSKEFFCVHGPGYVWSVDNDYDAMKLLISRLKDKDAVDWREHPLSRLRLVAKYAFEMQLFEIEAEAQAAISLQIANNRAKTFLLDGATPLIQKFVTKSNLDEKTMLPLLQEFISLHIQQNYLPASPQIYSAFNPNPSFAPNGNSNPNHNSNLVLVTPPVSYQNKTAEKTDGDDSDIESQYQSLVANLVAGTKQISDIEQKLATLSASTSAPIGLIKPTTSASTENESKTKSETEVAAEPEDPLDFLNDTLEEYKLAMSKSLRVDPSIPVVLPSLSSN